MKIAYLLHGHSRTWKDCYESFFENVYSVAPGDIYIHTWDRANSKYGSFWNRNLGVHSKEAEELSSQPVDLEGIKKAYNPKHMIVEMDRGLEVPLYECPQLLNLNATPSHIAGYNLFKAQYDVFKMAEYYGEYDRYFDFRFDLFFKSKFDKEELKYEDYMMVPPTFPDGMYHDPKVTMIWDIYALGTKKTIGTRAGFYQNMWKYWYSKNDLFNYFLEHGATQYYKDNGIEAKPSSLDLEVKRLF